MPRMTSIIAHAQVLWACTLALFILSAGLLFLAGWLGLAATSDPDTPGYRQKTNWSLQPLFWPILALLVDQAWRQYMKAWRNLPSREVIYREGALDTDAGSLGPLIARLQDFRPYLVALSVLLGLLLTAVDAGCLWAEYGAFGPPTSTCCERDFTIAFRLRDAFPSIAPSTNGWFVVAAYLLQGALITYGWLALLQLVLHSYSFLRFETLKTVASGQLQMLLNYKDPLREFGLTDVNRAINLTYIFIALGLALPVLSAYWNPEPDLGQWLLRILLPLIVLVPAAIPVAERMSRIVEAGERMRRDPDPTAQEQFAKQSLWPFEKTQIGYVGKIAAAVAAGEYLYLITKNIKDIL